MTCKHCGKETELRVQVEMKSAVVPLTVQSWCVPCVLLYSDRPMEHLEGLRCAE